MATKQKFLLTQEEYDALVAELDHLIHVEKPEVIKDLQLARSQGDLSENADYDAARDHQARLEARVNEINNILNNVQIVSDKVAGDAISIGSTVTFKDIALGEEATVVIKGNMGADPLADIPAISNESPLGRALIGHGVHEVVSVEAEDKYDVEILDVRKA